MLFKKDDKDVALKIKNQYVQKTTEKSKLQELKDLDNRVKKPVKIFSYTFGTVSSLVLGTGMCLAMGVIGGSIALGVVIGGLGIAGICSTYPIHKKILENRKQKYSNEIISKSNEIIDCKDYEETYEPVLEQTRNNEKVSTYAHKNKISDDMFDEEDLER